MSLFQKKKWSIPLKDLFTHKMQLLIKYFREPEKQVSKTEGIPFLAHTHTKKK